MRGRLSVLVLFLLGGCANEATVIFYGENKNQAADSFIESFECPGGLVLTKRNLEQRIVICREIVE